MTHTSDYEQQYEVVDVDEDSRVYALPETQVREHRDGWIDCCLFSCLPRRTVRLGSLISSQSQIGDPPAAPVRGAEAQVPTGCVSCAFSLCFAT